MISLIGWVVIHSIGFCRVHLHYFKVMALSLLSPSILALLFTPMKADLLTRRDMHFFLLLVRYIFGPCDHWVPSYGMHNISLLSNVTTMPPLLSLQTGSR